MNWNSYHRLTRTATYGFVTALPLLVAYETCMLIVGGQMRVGAEVWMKQVLGWIGVTGYVAFGVVVAVVGAAVWWRERKRGIALKSRYVGTMLVESTIYAVVLAWLVSGTVGLLFAAAPSAPDVVTQLILSIGAGLYEELLFRVLLVGGLYLAFRHLLPQRAQAYGVAAVVGALCFSAVHYIGPFGDAFAPASFTFRFLFGLALNAVFLARGFGVAAWTHALYDVLLTLGLL